MENYNGWSNYATWKVNLEILGDIEFEEPVTADDLKDIVEDCVFRGENNLAEDYARAFLNQVNYNEIAELINEEL
jgi:hypothetical protein